jgi:ABC-type branched-subunit amino acid transport system substrate-binding protein
VAAVRELAELGVSAIVGPVGTVEEAAKEAQDRGIPIITLTGRDDIRRTGDCVFRNFLTGKMQVDALANYAMDRLGLRRFAIFYPDEAYGKDMVRLFRDRVGAKGGNIVGAISYSPKTQDYKSQIRKLTGQSGPTREDGDDDGESGYIEDDDLPVHGGKAPRPVIDFDAVFIPDEGEKIAMILPQMARCGIRNVCFLGTNLWHTPRLIEKSGRFLQKTILTEGFFPQSKDPVVQDFVSAYKTAYSGTPGFLEAVTYDSAMIVMDAIRRGASSHKNLRDNLLAMKKFKGVTGITSFDVSGDAIKTVYLLKADDKGFGEIRH